MATRRKSNNRTRKNKRIRRGGKNLTEKQIQLVRNSMKPKHNAINSSNSFSHQAEGNEYDKIRDDPTILTKPEYKERIENGKIFGYFTNTSINAVKNALGLRKSLTNAQIKSVRNSMKPKHNAINTSNSGSQELSGIEYDKIYSDPTILTTPEFKERLQNERFFDYFTNKGNAVKKVLGLN